MVSKHQAGEFWALKNALKIREKIKINLIKNITYGQNKKIYFAHKIFHFQLLLIVKKVT